MEGEIIISSGTGYRGPGFLAIATWEGEKMRHLIAVLVAMVVVGVGQVEANIIAFTYTGGFEREGHDHAGIEGDAVVAKSIFSNMGYLLISQCRGVR